MKTTFIYTFAYISLAAGTVFGQSADYFTNYVRQVQKEEGVPEADAVKWDVSVAPTSPDGGQLSALAINPGGARFELWTVQSDPLTTYLLDSKYVGTYVPVADVVITTEDPYIYTGIPRTRADRPFVVEVTTNGLLNVADVPDAPEASQSVKLLRHVQSYGVGGTDVGIDREQAILVHQVSLVDNATHRLSYAVSSIPGADRSKIRGEETFSVYSLEDYQSDPSKLGSMRVQIWPVADGSISGIADGEVIRFDAPQLTLTLHDLYPDSTTYAQVYEGAPRLGAEGTVITGGARTYYGANPLDITLIIPDWDSVLGDDGQWTLEILTDTPFGTDRLDSVSFTLDRTMEVNGTFTTIETD